jgi:uncharacterized protein YaeQ
MRADAAIPCLPLTSEIAMALKATIFKAAVQIADMDRYYYHDHALTIARHPSETDERMMVRLLAFALHAHADLSFGKGLSNDDEPDLWRKDLTGAIELWIDIGQPDEKRMRRACGRAAQVFVYAHGGQGAGIWWNQISGKLERLRNLTVTKIPAEHSRAMAVLARRNMKLNYTIQDEQFWVADTDSTVQVGLERVFVPAPFMR